MIYLRQRNNNSDVDNMPIISHYYPYSVTLNGFLNVKFIVNDSFWCSSI